MDNEKAVVDTTITVHLFGKKGQMSISIDDFQIFYNNLQRELIEIEFDQYARGKSEISSVDFAHLVLRYSKLPKNEHKKYIQRIYERSELDGEGITKKQFEQFLMFLNNLEEFAKSVRLYSAANITVSQSEFIRAVKCSTKYQLDPHLVKILYQIFDTNNDDKLSYSEFIGIMNDRLHRGFKNYSGRQSTVGWNSFKNCMTHNLSNY